MARTLKCGKSTMKHLASRKKKKSNDRSRCILHSESLHDSKKSGSYLKLESGREQQRVHKVNPNTFSRFAINRTAITFNSISQFPINQYQEADKSRLCTAREPPGSSVHKPPAPESDPTQPHYPHLVNWTPKITCLHLEADGTSRPQTPPETATATYSAQIALLCAARPIVD